SGHSRWHYHSPVSASRRAGERARCNHSRRQQAGRERDHSATARTGDAARQNDHTMTAIKIAPSLLSADFSRLESELRDVEAGADRIHLDVLVGHFVTNITIGLLYMKAWRAHSKLQFDCALMIELPQK